MVPAIRQRAGLLPLLPFAVGAVAFFLVVGMRALDPTNLAWLGEGDPATHYLGWLHFRNSDWSFPIGENPSYGLELSSTILYSDSNPLLALLLKPFSSALPATFQYFGFWLLACFCLQAWFGWKLLGLISDSVVIRALGAGLFVFAPPMIWRLHGHFSLVGHFLVLAALYLVFSPKLERRRLMWGGLLVVSAMVHAYLLVMVLLIWITDLANKAVNSNLTFRAVGVELLTLMTATGIACWQVGYFSVGVGVSAGGYGLYRMNVLSIFDPSAWSFVLRDIPEGPGDYEGFNFLGLGNIMLLVSALPVLFSGKARLWEKITRYGLLLVLFIALSAFAISNQIAVGAVLYEYPLPEWVTRVANVFRASGRMFWPVFYGIIFAVMFLIVRGYGRRTATILLGLMLTVQVVDTSGAWMGIRKRLMTAQSSEWSTPLVDSFWEEAAAKYAKVRYIPVGNLSPQWQVLASYAGKYGLGTDAVYLARVDNLAIARAQQAAAEAVQSGNFDSDSLYIFGDAAFRDAANTIDTTSDLQARIDGFNVVAPGWKQCATCRSVYTEITKGELSVFKIGERILFNNSSPGIDYLGRGWSGSEPWGTWSEGEVADILLPRPPEGATTIAIEANPLVTPAHPRQRVSVEINGVAVANLALTEPQEVFELTIPEVVRRSSAAGNLTLRFQFADAVEPTEIGLGSDSRVLAIGLVAITYN